LNETKGEQHQQVFYVTCKLVALEIEAKGKGDTRRKAEQNAAKAALKQLNQL
jgi:ribonuclease-3